MGTQNIRTESRSLDFDRDSLDATPAEGQSELDSLLQTLGNGNSYTLPAPDSDSL